jgi:GT2 family glycosyltransferase/predicted transport protein
MITVGYSSREHKPEFIEYLKKSSGYKKINVIEKINNGEKSLAQVYNEILKESETDIIVFCHDDIYFDTNSWYSKITKHFEKTDYGIIGMAGTTSMPASGKWWEDRRKMIGIVNHESGGKKWESKYSESIGSSVTPVIVLDGVFIAVSKSRIKKNFNEEFEGFHFYDIPFCFENFMEGVKIGVITNIRITHKSIGATNDQWEKNRQLFETKYSQNLPVKIPYDTQRKIRVLLSCLFFKTFTGSELYVYELAQKLQKLGCDVKIMSQIGGVLTDMAKRQGIKVISFEQAPGFKLGDGKWGFTTEKGFQPSTPNMMYRVTEAPFDIIHMQHKPVAERMIQFYPEVEKVYSIHSEVIELENPIKHESIKKYIAIRPEIKNYMIENFQISENEIEVIYNPIDENKFVTKNVKKENAILFVGTIDYLRRETIMDLIDYTKENEKELWIVGEDKSNYLPQILLNSHVKHFPPTWNVESFINRCSETAGIQLGRTTIEGWLCQKPGWIYKVDSNGFIISKELYQVPDDVEKYHSSKVSEKIKNIYREVLS